MAMLASCYKKRNNSKICLSPQGSEKKWIPAWTSGKQLSQSACPGHSLFVLVVMILLEDDLPTTLKRKSSCPGLPDEIFFEPWARCLTTRSVCSLMNLLMEDIDTRKQIFFFLFERLWRHLQEFHSKKCLHFRNSARGNHCNDVSKNENSLFWWPTFDNLTWLRGFLVTFVYLVWFSLCSSLCRELQDNGVVKNSEQFCP